MIVYDYGDFFGALYHSPTKNLWNGSLAAEDSLTDIRLFE